MITIRLKTLFLSVCIMEAAWLLVAQTVNNPLLLLPCLVVFLALVVWSAIKNMAMPVMLFFLPFAPLLKINPDSISFFTIALLMIYAIYTIIGSRNVRILHLVPALCLVALVLVVKVVYGYSINNDFIMFAITLMLIPFLVREMDGQYSFFWLTLFFALGIGLAAITAGFMTMFPTINRYIDVNTALGFARRSGYYGDPNFYSTHITTALGGVLVLFLHNDKRRKLLALIPMIALLFYCGLISVSKSFWLVCICILLFWIGDLLFRKGRVSIKVMLIFAMIITLLYLVSSTVFMDLLSSIMQRFAGDHNLSEFTTGRTDLWVSYLKTMADDPMLLLFGKGFSDVLVDDHASHNTIIQSVFQFGIVGSILFFGWLVCFVRTLLDGAKIRWSNMSQIAILMIGAFGPWMALDYLFFDELFLLPVYVSMAIRFISERSEAASPLIYEKAWDE